MTFNELSFRELTEDELLEITGGGKKAGAAVMGAMQGALTGAPYGPYGMVFGAAYGAFWGVVFSG
jgi:lactobin A/cerein 7B family class IIb bacteriocin